MEDNKRENQNERRKREREEARQKRLERAKNGKEDSLKSRKERQNFASNEKKDERLKLRKSRQNRSHSSTNEHRSASSAGRSGSKEDESRNSDAGATVAVALIPLLLVFVIAFSIAAPGMKGIDFDFNFGFLDLFSKECTVSFDINYKGGENPPAQTVAKGKYATAPSVAYRDGYLLSGWYTEKNEKDWSKLFDFPSTPIKKDVKLRAVWIDIKTDNDNDGLANDFEKYIKTDIDNPDTDGDGLNDYLERILLEYNPLDKDTDGDGVSDYDEDYDEDKLTNGEEVQLGTELIISDTDNDGLGDYDEVKTHKTSPVIFDTDEDKAKDGDEIRLGTNPLVAENTFKEKVSLGEIGGSQKISVEITSNVSGEQVGKMNAESVGYSDNHYVSPMIPGYIDNGVDVELEGGINNGQIAIHFDSELWKENADFSPAIYHFNEETKTYDKLPGQSVSGNCVTASMLGSGNKKDTYILIDETEYNKVWKGNIKKPITDEYGNASHIDMVFNVDVSGSMRDEKIQTAKGAINKFLDAMEEKNRAALVKFESESQVVNSLTNDKSVLRDKVNSLKTGGLTSMYAGLEDSLDILTDPQEKYGYRMIIVLSDGKDEPETTYESHYASSVNKAVNNKVVIYTIGVGDTVDTHILEKVASATGGQYYHADSIDDVVDVFKTIQENTIDLTKDSNYDDIPDYYNDLIKSGDLVLSNGSGILRGIDFNFDEDGNSSADYDGDGIINGEELKIQNNDAQGKVYAIMLSDPMVKNTDGDKYDDYEELKQNSDPYIPTFPKGDIDYIMDNNNFTYVSLLEEEDKFFNRVARNTWATISFNCSHVDEAKRDMTHIFEKQGSEESIEQAAENIKKEAYNELCEDFISHMHKAVPTAISVPNEAESIVGEVTRAVKTWQSSANSLKTPGKNTHVGLMDIIKKFSKEYNVPYELKFEKFCDKFGLALSGISFLIEQSGDMVDFYENTTRLLANAECFRENKEILVAVKNNDKAKEKFVSRAADEILLLVEEEYLAFFAETSNELYSITHENIVSFGINILASGNPYTSCINTIISLIDLALPVSVIGENTYSLYVADEISNAANGLVKLNSGGKGVYDIVRSKRRNLEMMIYARKFGSERGKIVTQNQFYGFFGKTEEVRKQYAETFDSEMNTLDNNLKMLTMK